MEYDKLVRDKIPEIIRKKGEEPVTFTCPEEEILEMLKRKLLEEVNEFIDEEVTEELADILEVVYAICDARGISEDDLERIRKEKLEKRGGFEKHIILDRVEKIDK